jgi:hypothetical protein
MRSWPQQHLLVFWLGFIVTDWDEDAFCLEEAIQLQLAMDTRQWAIIEEILDNYCHERLSVQPDSVGICSFEVSAVIAPELCTGRRRGQKLQPSLGEWPQDAQERILVLANHVLGLLRSGQSGC